MGIVMKVNMIAALILVGFAFGCQPLVGYNYGARNKKRLKEILAFCYKFEAGRWAAAGLARPRSPARTACRANTATR